MPRHRLATCALAVGALLAAAGCGGDDDATSPTSTAAPPTTAPVDATTDPAGATTASPNLVPNDSSLVDQLLDPADVGEGYTPDDTLGDGTFDGDLCEDVVIAPSWDDEAGQALSRPADDGDLDTFTQAVLSFSDEAAAAAFVTEVGDGQGTCLGGSMEPVTAGDEALLLVVNDEEGASASAVVRVGARVTVLTALGPTDPGPVDEDLVATAAAGLGA